MIDRNTKFLAASPDGIVTYASGESGLIEIKKLLHSKPLNLYQTAETTSNFCLHKVRVNGTLILKEHHAYYYQCQGLLHICNYPWIDFIARTLNPYQLFIQSIFKDEVLWTNTMLPKLKAFYLNVLLPELASPRQGKTPGIREPCVWYTALAAKHTSTVTRKARKTTKSTSNCKRSQLNSKDNPDTNSEKISILEPCTRSATSRTSTRHVRFEGRRIQHEWVVDEESGRKEWYEGIVLSLLKGKDGVSGAVYEVSYDGEDEAYEIDHLIEDYENSSVKFVDI